MANITASFTPMTLRRK